MTDAGTGWANIVSNTIVPAATTILNILTAVGMAYDEAFKKGEWGIKGFKNLLTAFVDAKHSILDETDALLKNTGALEENAEATNEASNQQNILKEATSRLSFEYQGLISSMFTIQSGMDSYAEKTADIAQKEEDLTNKKKAIAYAMTLVNDDYDEYLRLVKESIELDGELAKLDGEKAKVTEDMAEASKKRIYGLTQQRLAADGVIDSGE